MKSNDLKPGNAVNMDNDLYIVMDKDHVKPGKGPAYVQLKLKNVASGGIMEKRMRTSDDVEYVTLDRREKEYLYSDGSGHIFMDSEDYEQDAVPDSLIGDQMKYIKPNTTITTLVYNGNIVTIELPKSIELEVIDTAPQAKGATATNQLKEAELETGLKTRVPPFIENGEVIKINTDDGSYISRA